MKLSIDSIYSCMSKSISKQEYLPRFIIILYSLPSLLLLGNSLLLIRRYGKNFPFFGQKTTKNCWYYYIWITWLYESRNMAIAFDNRLVCYDKHIQNFSSFLIRNFWEVQLSMYAIVSGRLWSSSVVQKKSREKLLCFVNGQNNRIVKKKTILKFIWTPPNLSK